MALNDWAGSWQLDPQRSEITFRSPTMWGLAKVKGTFTEVDGAGQVRGSRRHFEGHWRAVQRRHLDLSAQGGLGERHRNSDGEMLAAPAEHRVRRDVHADVEVARGPASLARCSLALEPDALTVAYTAGDPHAHHPARGATAGAVAHRARVVDDQAAAHALAAWLGQREPAPCLPTGVAGAVACRANPGNGTCLGPGPRAGCAR